MKRPSFLSGVLVVTTWLTSNRTEKMPAVDVSPLDGHLAWPQHDGGHTDGPNWKHFIPWADKFHQHKP